jgi:two-component system cell cycle response regulator
MEPRVLVIEDSVESAALMAYLLRSFGCRALIAADGECGVALALQHQPDLVLCDIQLPGIDGFEVVRQLRQAPALARVPMVALTAQAMMGDDQRILERGFDAYMAKPIDLQGFGALVRKHLPERTPAGSTAAALATPAAAPPQPPLATILALDDIRLNLELMRGLLEPHGWRVLTAQTMGQALTLAREELPDLIISDVGMKQGSGFEFITALKADPALQHIPVLFLSSTHWDDASRERGLALGAARYLRRPMDSHRLLGEIRALLGR